MFPAWRPAQLPGDILSPWPRAQALPLARSAPAVWVPSRSPGGAQEPREFREVGKDTQILSAADRERCPRHLTPGPWPASRQTHTGGAPCPTAGPVGDLGTSSTSLDSLPEAMTYGGASPGPHVQQPHSMENAQFASWVPFAFNSLESHPPYLRTQISPGPPGWVIHSQLLGWREGWDWGVGSSLGTSQSSLL